MTFRARLRVRALKGEDPIRHGYKRSYDQCRRCERIYTRDYVPYSLSNPILTLPCGHGIAERYENTVRCVGTRLYSEGEEIN